jgi:hypothetical protein
VALEQVDLLGQHDAVGLRAIGVLRGTLSSGWAANSSPKNTKS